MRHNDSLYYRWLRAESRCRSISHRVYLIAQMGARPPESLLREFSETVDAAIEVSGEYLEHVRGLGEPA